MRNLLDDLAVLTGVGKYNYQELVSKVVTVLSHNVAESIRDREESSVTDIGIGQLITACVDNKVYYKFIPSHKLEATIRNTYKDKQSALKLQVDETLGKRITNTYKDLF